MKYAGVNHPEKKLQSNALPHTTLRYLLTMFIGLLVVPMTSCGQAGEVKGNSPAQLQVDGLAAKLARAEIGRIEIFQMPGDVETRTSVTPELLEKWFSYRLTIQDIRGSVDRDKLIEATKSIVVQTGGEMADVRWGVVFYSLDESRAGALYFGRWGNRGAVGDTPVSFKGGFFEWLDGRFSGCFR